MVGDRSHMIHIVVITNGKNILSICDIKKEKKSGFVQKKTQK